MAYLCRFGWNKPLNAYDIIPEYGVAIGGYKAVAQLEKDGIEIDAIVMLYAEEIGDRGRVEDLLDVEINVEEEKEEEEEEDCEEEDDWKDDDCAYCRGIKMMSIPMLRINIYDDEDEDDYHTHIGKHFDYINDFVAENVTYPRQIVLFQCASGVSRSSTACCAYLMKTYRLSFDDALCAICIKRDVDPNPWFRAQLRKYEATLTCASTIRRCMKS